MWRLWLKCSTLISAVAIDLFWRKADKLCHEHRMARRQMKWLEERKITWLHRGQSSYRERHHCLESTGTSYCPGGDTAQLAEAWGRHLRLFVTARPGGWRSLDCLGFGRCCCVQRLLRKKLCSTSEQLLLGLSSLTEEARDSCRLPAKVDSQERVAVWIQQPWRDVDMMALCRSRICMWTES